MNNEIENISDLDSAKSILEQHAQPYDNMIDKSDLFFAATEYQNAYESALAEAVEREKVLVDALKRIREYAMHDGDYSAGSVADQAEREI